MEYIMLFTRIFIVFGLVFCFSFAEANTGDDVCYPIFEKGGAIPNITSCATKINGVDAGDNKICKTDPSYSARYCSDSCYANVVALDNLPRPPSAPQNGFTDTQTCIAKKSCINKSDLTNPLWLDPVVTTFVTPYTTKSGDWNKVIASCKNYLVLQGLFCQQKMAAYHIANDLQNSLNKHGCGTQTDWDKIGDNISQCVAAANNAVVGAFADAVVQSKRNEVRDRCIVYRQAHNLPIETEFPAMTPGQAYWVNGLGAGSSADAAAQAAIEWHAQAAPDSPYTTVLDGPCKVTNGTFGLCNWRAIDKNGGTASSGATNSNLVPNWQGTSVCTTGLYFNGACQPYTPVCRTGLYYSVGCKP